MEGGGSSSNKQGLQTNDELEQKLQQIHETKISYMVVETRDEKEDDDI